ncbi:MAG: Dabb family protein [Acidimicrobiia bacterium]
MGEPTEDFNNMRHCIMLTFKPEATPEALNNLAEALRALPAQISEIRSYEVGLDLGYNDANYQLGIIASFENREDWQTYLDHPAHQAVVRDHIAPIVTARAAIQF